MVTFPAGAAAELLLTVLQVVVMFADSMMVAHPLVLGNPRTTHPVTGTGVQLMVLDAVAMPRLAQGVGIPALGRQKLRARKNPAQSTARRRCIR